ncbi:ABC transporter ATP-binding protein [Nocardioides massiliensis]|uniref:ATP-binding cassette subfamily C protein n=1 Tax=Nocardioides massiliensis TaxID=1325935 RepID=A0ABT9NR29_9ACTN|nr:ABC transporter ATP-binding protein [Nocardioides massiliensis]MDP9822260.1 ATP-binding cassette subfamily C protein [Nocardioides massiliensis]
MSASPRGILPIADRRATTRLVWSTARRHRAALLAALASFLVGGLALLVAPRAFGYLVDAIDGPGDGDGVLLGVVVAIAVAGVVGGLAQLCATVFLARAGEPALADLREEVLDRALHLDTQRLEEAGAGDVLSRVSDDVRTVSQSLVEVVPSFVQALVAVVFTAAGLFALDWRLGLAGLAAAPAYALGVRWYLPRSGPIYAAERVAQGERAEALVAGVHGADTLRAYGREQAQLDLVARKSWDAVSYALNVMRLLTRFGARNNRSELVGLLAVLSVGFLLVRDDAVTVGAVTAAALYFHRLFNPIGALIFLFDEVQSTGASLARIAGVIGMPAPVLPADPPRPANATLTLRGIGHAYEAGAPVLHDVDLVLAPGERVALVGATGAGKTTLGAIAAGVLVPTRGEVLLGGVPLAQLGRRELRRHIALVSQEVHVFSGTVREAVTLARADADDADVRAALETVRAWGWVTALPDGLDTRVGGDGVPLSGAQAQQLALARVVLADPPVVVLDEATAEAGSAGARDLEIAALAATEGRTAITVAHRLTQARAADRIVVLDAGCVVEAGSHDELVAAGGRYADLWAAWSA